VDSAGDYCNYYSYCIVFCIPIINFGAFFVGQYRNALPTTWKFQLFGMAIRSSFYANLIYAVRFKKRGNGRQRTANTFSFNILKTRNIQEEERCNERYYIYYGGTEGKEGLISR